MALFKSSTRTIPDAATVPRHIAIIMDGNGRWAKQRFMPRVMGHQRGVETVREMVKACRQMGVEYLTLFAFSSENWRRPADEVSFLMQLFMKMLEREVSKLHQNNIRLKVIGDRLQSQLRSSDTVARLGGDEFLILLPEAGLARAGGKIAAKILGEIRHPCLIAGRKLQVSTSIGMAIYPRDGRSAETLIKKADQAMYAAKARGGDTCCRCCNQKRKKP